MNYKNLFSFSLAIAAAAALFASGCAGPEKTSTSPTLPAAQGTLKCDEAENNNTSIDLKVQHLADPAKLTPPAAAYVVWTRANKNAQPQNIGALQVSDDLTGRLKTVTPQTQFELFVTPEGSATAQAPSGESLMWANCKR